MEALKRSTISLIHFVKTSAFWTKQKTQYNFIIFLSVLSSLKNAVQFQMKINLLFSFELLKKRSTISELKSIFALPIKYFGHTFWIINFFICYYQIWNCTAARKYFLLQILTNVRFSSLTKLKHNIFQLFFYSICAQYTVQLFHWN